MKKFIDEFKAFALKGNMIDMAVGMIIGSAFTGVVNNLMSSIFNPLIGLLMGNVDLKDALKVVLVPAVMDGETVVTPEVALCFGAFISTLLNFLIMAFVVFMFVKGLNKLRTAADTIGKKKKKKEEPAAPAAPTTKICPFCKSEIAIDATRCPHCTSELE